MLSQSGNPQLPWGDVNVVIVTDVHSWIGGHARHAPALLLAHHRDKNQSNTTTISSPAATLQNVDYGNVLSFYQHLQDYAVATKRNLFFVMNGDFVHGTGLTEFPKPHHLTSLLQEHMPWDAINIGNHELYHNSTIEFLHDLLLHPKQPQHSTDDDDYNESSNKTYAWKERYLTSNVLYSATHEPLGNRFIYLRGPSATVLTFGFLYNFQSGAADAALVESVQDVVQADWFTDALTVSSSNDNNKEAHFDAILVLAHMDYLDSLVVQVLLPAMRQMVGPDMPIQFVTGHTHIRGHAVLDDMSTSLQAGRYLDTIGFCSFPTKQQQRQQSQEDKDDVRHHSFQHILLDANQEKLRSILQVPQLNTPDGVALSARIHQTQQDLGLLRPIGCSPNTYYLDYGLDHVQSLWRLYLSQVLPSTLFRSNYITTTINNNVATALPLSSSPMIFLQGTDGLRFDLFQGQVLVDDAIAVSPFHDVIYQVLDQVRGDVVLQIFETKAASVAKLETTTASAPLPEYAFAIGGGGDQQEPFPSIVAHEYYQLMTVELDLNYVLRRIENVTGTIPTPKPVLLGGRTGQVVTSTQLWIGFVQTQWPSSSFANGHACPQVATDEARSGKPLISTEKPNTFLVVAITVAVLCVLLLVGVGRGLAVLRRGFQGYKATSVALEQEGAVSELELAVQNIL
jgi:2',3'-cyclic-nucleotide 2'-phosphodiesterase (5'-nucleotidase family)